MLGVNVQYKNVIGFSGKIGSGKSFACEYISKKTGIPLMKFDYQMGEVINRPFIKWMLERRIKNKIPNKEDIVQLFPLLKNLDRGFGRFEIWVLVWLLNRKLKKELKKYEGRLIVDFCSLPLLSVSKGFGANYLLTCDEDMRIKQLSRRDGMTEENTARVDKFLEKYYGYEDFNFDKVFFNDFDGMPDGVDELIAELDKDL